MLFLLFCNLLSFIKSDFLRVPFSALKEQLQEEQSGMSSRTSPSGAFHSGLAGLLSGFPACGTLGASSWLSCACLGVFLGFSVLSFGFLIFNAGEPTPAWYGCCEVQI